MHRCEPEKAEPMPIERPVPPEPLVPNAADATNESALSNRVPDSIANDVFNVLRGFCMGAADTVPGVSGGTVALVLGHYQRLITAISQIDSQALRLLSRFQLRAAACHVDFRFLAALGVGIVLGVLTMAGIMHWLLDHKQPETFAVFFGLIIGSVWIVKNYIAHWHGKHVVALMVGAIVAFGITQMPSGGASMSLPSIFFCASVAVCAMILPGISGAFVLLLFGIYHPITGLIKNAAHGDITAESLLQLGIFAAGCAFGLLAFSRLLHWLLDHHRGTTMAGLIGLMLGSAGKLWPLQMPTAETAEMESKFRQMEIISPSQWPGSVGWLIGLAIGATLAVVMIEAAANKLEKRRHGYPATSDT
ncbi:DUF368 domain-containing protein [Novipirellula artificiosorum]|uniref:DUF368 domain-containing protein n=1 Tax=Novipirellula artificiosorum TaxID=2528016 RepID=A0A5C6DYI7_9BACT|nr:DUF368 domain-containing protein [Novipirellula artificiosorum]TWU40471.1 hypothetical protein Poly41_13040 [Novipirellula artificiosorum]